MAEILKPKENFDPKIDPKEDIRLIGSKEEIKSLSPEGVYSYETDTNPENFGDVSYDPINKPRNNLSPPSPFIPRSNKKPQPTNPELDFCAKFPEDPRCTRVLSGYCQENPSDPKCNENKPVGTLYEKKQDDTQMQVGKVIRSECKCKDGSVVLGYLDTRTGQKDCSPCKKSVFNSPNIYKNYQTKKKTPNFQGKQVPLREQVGVSNFGDVNMKGCETGNARQSLESVNASATLNKIINTDTLDSVGGTKVTEPKSLSGMPISLYDGLSTNVYGI